MSKTKRFLAPTQRARTTALDDVLAVLSMTDSMSSCEVHAFLASRWHPRQIDEALEVLTLDGRIISLDPQE